MRVIFGLVFAFGLAMSGLSTYLVKRYVDFYKTELAKQRAASARVVPTSQVYVLTRPIRYGEKLMAKDVRAVTWPTESIPEGSFLVEAADLFPPGAADYRSALRTMEKGEPILKVKVTAPGVEAGISARLSPGFRAFAIQVDVQTGVSGLLRPGDRVDVYWTGQGIGTGAQSGAITKLIEPGLQIIAVDQSADIDMEKTAIARTITVQATPQQVAGLTQAQATGRLSLSLLGGSDTTVADTRDVDQRSLIGYDEPEVVESEVKRVCTVTTRRGSEKTTETPIDCRK